MVENKYPYDNWKSITESDFATLFIKTWFAFVSTLREMYPAEIPYYQATGDSRYISPYKRDFSQNIAYRLNYTDIKYHFSEVYKHGMKIIADRYPRFIVDDFYSLNLSFKETASEEFSLEGGFNGKFICTVKCASAETLTATIMCTDKSYRTKVDKDYNREPPPDIDWPTDEEAKFTWFYSEMLKLNKYGVRVLLKGKIDFAEHHYETECTVRWNESLSETAIKNASITRVAEPQEKKLAAAI